MSRGRAQLKVLMISDVYFPRVNGVSTSIQTFRKELSALQCDSWLIAPDYAGAWDDDDALRRVRARPVPFDPEDRLMGSRAAQRLCLDLQGRYDLIHVHTPFVAHRVGVRLARRSGVRIVETCHTHFEEYFHCYLPAVPRRVLRFAARVLTRSRCNAVDAVIAPSEPMAGVLRGYDVQSPIHVVPTGLDLDAFAGGDGERFRARHRIDRSRPLMLHVGRIAFEKNVDFIVQVLAAVRDRIPEVLLVLAGEGPAVSALRRRVAALGLDRHVLFVGYLDRRDALLDCYRSADVFVFASNTETQGLVLLEALAAGTPVVSTAVLGSRAVLENARGAVVVEPKLATFSDAVVRVLLDDDLRRNLSRQAREHVAVRWSSRATADRLLEVYRDLLARPAQRAAAKRVSA